MATKYVVLAAIEEEDGNQIIHHVATCLDQGDAIHLAGMIESSGVIEVGDEEWVNPMYSEIASAGEG